MKTPNSTVECQLIDAVMSNVRDHKERWSVDGDHINEMVWTNVDDGIVISTSPKMVERENGDVPYPNPHRKKCFDITLEIDERTHKFTKENGEDFHGQLYELMNPVDNNMGALLASLTDIHYKHVNGDNQGKQLSEKDIEKVFSDHIDRLKNKNGDGHSATTSSLAKDLDGRVNIFWK